MKIRFIPLIFVLILTLSGCSSSPAPAPSDRGSSSSANASSNAPKPSESAPASKGDEAWPEIPVSDFDYEYDGETNGVVIKKYKGKNTLKVRIPDTVEGEPVTSIRLSAFSGSGVMSVYIPACVKRVVPTGTKLANIIVDADNANYADIDGVLFDKSKTVLIQFPQGRAGSYSIPDGVVEIGPDAFQSCAELDSINIPNSVTKIDNKAFSGTEQAPEWNPNTNTTTQRFYLDEATRLRILEINPDVKF